MKKQTKSSLTRKLDKICSDITRAKGYCEKCGPHVHKDYAILQCCHVYSRTYRSVRWDFRNLLCLCAGCHFAGHRKPLEFSEWVRTYLGEIKYQELKQSANSIRKWTLSEMVEYYDALKSD